MAQVLRLAVVDPNERNREALKRLLLEMDSVWLEAECSRYEFFEDIARQCQPDVALVALDENPARAMELIESLRNLPGCSLVALSRSSDGELILRAIRAGAREFLTQPLDESELQMALDRIGHSQAQSGSARQRSGVCIAVAGAGGGVGTTSLAVNLGCALAADDSHSVALVDLDMALGDADVFLDTIPDYTLADVSQNMSRMDFSLLKKSMTQHRSGLYLLPRPVHLQEVSQVGPEDVRRVLGLLKASFTHVIVDLSKSYSELDMAALAESDQVLLVTQLDIPCLRNVVRLSMSFDEVDGLRDKTRVVVNRVGLDAGQIGVKKAQDTIGRDVFWQVPNDYRTMGEVRNNGVPLLEQFPKAGITQSIVGLAAALDGGDAASATERVGGASSWLNFWPTRRVLARRES